MPSKLRTSGGVYVSANNIAEVPVVANAATFTTTGAIDTYITAPVTGTLTAAQLTPLVALAASDTNYLTFTMTNLGQDGTGTTVMLAATDPNTTKATGGAALAINTRRNLTVHGTAANLAVVKGDRIKITATATGTLANTVTVPTYLVTFKRNV